jgi:hypothetical protein
LARLYFDHNVTRRMEAGLRADRHDLLFTRDPAVARLSDDAHLLAAVREDRILITHDRHDFRLLHDAWVTWPAAFGMALPPHPGILVLDSSPPETLARVLAVFLGGTSAEELANAIFWWHRHDGWRQPGAGVDWEPFLRRGVSEQE